MNSQRDVKPVATETDNAEALSEPTTLDKAHAAATAAISELIAAILTTSEPHRFHDAARAALIGKELISLGGQRARDFMGAAMRPHHGNQMMAFGNVGGEFDANANIMMPGAPMPMQGFGHGPLDSNELIRQALLLLGPAQQTTTELNRAQTARAEAEEMESLLKTRNLLGLQNPAVDDIDKRIETLKKGLEVRNAAKSDLVRSELPRGHQAGGEGGEGNPRDGVRLDAPRGGGDAVIAHPLPQRRVG